MSGEFDLIAAHFAPLAGPAGLGLLDDAAVFAPPEGRELVVSADAMVEGVHFLPEDPPDLVARKLLRVNLSDLAAMGATPLHYLVTIAVPRGEPAWFAAFAAGLAEDQAAFGIRLAGGDTSSTSGPISLSATVIGHVAPGMALRRGGARPGDGLWVTGTIGDAALGLLAHQHRLADPTGALVRRYRLPEPRIGLALAGIASAALDISDGLLQDAGHLARRSGIGVRIDAPRIPLSAAARDSGPQWFETCLTGGDDYELLLAVPAARDADLVRETQRHGVAVTRIGECIAGEARVQVMDAAGLPMTFAQSGWQHF